MKLTISCFKFFDTIQVVTHYAKHMFMFKCVVIESVHMLLMRNNDNENILNNKNSIEKYIANIHAKINIKNWDTFEIVNYP